MITLYVIFCIQRKSLALLYSFINFHCKNNLFTPFNINIKNQLSLDITSRHCSQICYTCSTKVYRLYFVHVFALAIKILNSWNMPHKPCWCMYMQCSSPLISSVVICQHIINYLQLLWYLPSLCQIHIIQYIHVYTLSTKKAIMLQKCIPGKIIL